MRKNLLPTLGTVRLRPMLKLLFLILFALYVFRKFIFGENVFVYRDVFGDSFVAYLPFITQLHELFSIKSLLSLEVGLGQSLFSLSTCIFDFFNVLIIFFKKSEIALSFAYMAMFKSIMATVGAYFYLKENKIDKDLSAIISFVYGFSSYMLINGGHYFFASAAVHGIWIFYALEQFFNDQRKYLFLILNLSLASVTSYYFFFKICVFSLLFFIVRLFPLNKTQARKSLIILLQLSGCYIISIGISFFIFLPTVMTLFQSSRLSGSVLDHWQNMLVEGKGYYFTLIANFLDAIILKPNQQSFLGVGNFSNTPKVFWGSFVLVAIFSKIFHSILKSSEKTIRESLFFIVPFLFLLSPLLFSTFSFFSGTHTRWSYLLGIPVILLIARMFQDIKDRGLREYKYPLIFSMILKTSMWLMTYLYFFFESSNLQRWYLERFTLFLVVDALFILGIYFFQSNPKKLAYALLCLFLIEIAHNSNLELVKLRNPVKKNQVGENGIYYGETYKFLEKVKQADASKGNNEVYRVDKAYHVTDKNDPMLLGYSGLTSYGTNFSAEQTRFYDFFARDARHEGYEKRPDGLGHKADVLNVLGVRYFFNRAPYAPFGYKLIYEHQDFFAFEKNDWKGFASVSNNDFSISELKELSRVKIWPVNDSENQLVFQYENLDPLKNHYIEFKFEGNKEAQGSLKFFPSAPSVKPIFAITLNVKPSIGFYRFPIVFPGKSEKMIFAVQSRSFKMKFLEAYLVTEEPISMGAEGLHVKRSGDSFLMETNYAVSKNVLVPIPVDAGDWKLDINGKSYEIGKTNYGLITFSVPPGKNNINLHYGSKGFTLSLIISLISLLIVCIVGMKNLFWKKLIS